MHVARSYSKKYPQVFRKQLVSTIPSSEDLFMGENAVEFLMLRENQTNRKRLDAFYSKYKVPARWRALIDK